MPSMCTKHKGLASGAGTTAPGAFRVYEGRGGGGLRGFKVYWGGLGFRVMKGGEGGGGEGGG